MKRKKRILMVEHDLNDIELIQHEIRIEFRTCEFLVVQTGIDYRKAIIDFKPHLILSDYTLPSFSGIEAFTIRTELAPEIPFIFVTGTIDDEDSIVLLKQGATDYVMKEKLFMLNVKVLRALKEAIEISDKKIAEQALKEVNDQLTEANNLLLKTEKKFRSLIERSVDMVTLANAQGIVQYGSPSVTHILGYTIEEFVSKSVNDFIHVEDQLKYIPAITEVVLTPGHSCKVEQRLLHKNGHWVWCEGTITNLLDEPGVNAMVSNFRDISDKVIADQQRKFDRTNLDALINTLPDLMWSVDKDFNLMTCNQQFKDVISELSGERVETAMNVLSFKFPSEVLDSYRIYYERAFAGETFTEYIHNQPGQDQWLEMSFQPIRLGDIVVGIACHSRDITKNKKAEEKIRNNEAFNRGVLNSLSSHIAVVDRHGYIASVNQSWLRFALENGDKALDKTGAGVNYFEVCNTSTLAGDEYADKALRGIQDVLNGNREVYYLEYPCHSPDIKRWFGMRATSFNSHEPMVVISHTEITERIIAEDVVKISERHLAEAQRMAKMGSWNFDVQSDTLTWSEELYQVFDTDTDTFIETHGSFIHLVNKKDQPFVLQTSRHTQETGEPFTIEYHITTARGENRIIQEHGFAEKNSDGEVVRMFGTAQDITEQVLSRKQLQASEQRYRQIVETAQEGIWLIDEDHKTTFANRKMGEILGYTQAEMLGRTIFSFMDDDGVQSAAALIQQRDTSEWGAGNFKYISKQGKEVWTNLSANPLFDENNTYIGSLAMVTDITESKKIQEDLLRSSASLKEAQAIAKLYNWEVLINDSADAWVNELLDVYALNDHEIEEKSTTLLHAIYPEDETLTRSTLMDAVNSLKAGSLNFRFVTKEGSLRYGYTEWKFEFSRTLQPKRIYGILQDVTELTLAQNAIAQSNERYELASKATNDVLWDWDIISNKLYRSNNYTDLFGHSTEANNEDTWLKNIHPDDSHRVLKLLQVVMDDHTQPTWEDQYRFMCDNGEMAYVKDRGHILRNAHGKPIRMVGAMIDITSQKVGEDALLNEQMKLKEAQSIAHLGSWQMNFLSGSGTMSDETCRIFGLSIQDASQTFDTFKNLIHPDDVELVISTITSAQSALSIAAFDHRIVRKDGTMRYLHSECKFEVNENNIPIGLHGISHDITDLKLADFNRERMTNDLLTRNRDLEQFAYIVSHNLRSSVANILGLSNAIGDPDLEPEVKTEFQLELDVSAKKLDNVLTDLNSILEVKKNIVEKRKLVSMTELANDIHISLASLIQDERATITCDFTEIDEILTLKSYLHSIFHNLISNSIKYRQPGIDPVISITSRQLPGSIAIMFSDNGMGINMQKNGDQLFGLYKRFHSGPEGKGMGLFMTKTQVETLGGRISVSSEVNVGTIFTIKFNA